MSIEWILAILTIAISIIPIFIYISALYQNKKTQREEKILAERRFDALAKAIKANGPITNAPIENLRISLSEEHNM